MSFVASLFISVHLTRRFRESVSCFKMFSKSVGVLWHVSYGALVLMFTNMARIQALHSQMSHFQHEFLLNLYLTAIP